LIVRWLELALLLAPAAALALWWGLSRRGGPSPRTLAAAAAGLGILLVALLWVAEHSSLGRHETYVPATWQDGRMIPGHGAP
jgi:hypothetical protein